MFMGTFEHGLDAKGRVIIPAKLRSDLGDSFIICPGVDGNLNAFTESEFEVFANKLLELPGKQETRKFVRTLVGAASTCELDKQGRTLIPASLREFAGMTKEVVLVGAIDKIEIWSKERWDKMNNLDDLSTAADALAEFGIHF